ncbi:MAG TPA: hypothetical protein VK436_12430 [Methanocella sp.]|nr:hypothetical protein [Methanocella sp.]
MTAKLTKEQADTLKSIIDTNSIGLGSFNTMLKLKMQDGLNSLTLQKL